jgi:cAMP-dependent protein kinase regulator
LLYNHPRASTITAITAGRLFELDRQEFNLVLRSKMMQKLNECEDLVDKIDFFKDLDIYEKTKLF